MPIKFAKLKDWYMGNLVKVLIYGQSGVGKTMAAAKAWHDLSRVLIALSESQGARNARIANPEATAVSIRSLPEFWELHRALMKPCPKCAREVVVHGKPLKQRGSGCEHCRGTGVAGRAQFDLVVIDGITDLQRLIKIAVETDPKRPEGDKKLRSGALAQDDWGVVAHYMTQVFMAIRDMPYHVVCTAISTEYINEDSGIYRARPCLQGNVSRNTIGEFFNLIAHVKKEYEEDAQGNIKVLRKGVFDHPADEMTGKGDLSLNTQEPLDIARWIDRVTHYDPSEEQQAPNEAPELEEPEGWGASTDE